MRKLTFTEKKPTIYYTNPESTPLDLSKLQSTAVEIDDQDKLPQCAILLPNYSKNYGANTQFEAPVYNWQLNCELTYNDS